MTVERRFSVPNGTPWIQTLYFGGPAERWRLDDFEIYLEVKEKAGAHVLMSLSTLNGGLVVTDPAARRLEINAAAAAVSALGPGVFLFDLLFVNRVTGQAARTSPPETLTVTSTITQSGG